MIVPVDLTNIIQAAAIHSISWKESHRDFCSHDFIELHTIEHQQKYLYKKMQSGSKLYMLIEDVPIGIVSITGNLIEDLYVLPDKQNKGYGTKLLKFAIKNCNGMPVLWILENNINAERLYRKMGFKETGNINSKSGKLKEIEFALK